MRKLEFSDQANAWRDRLQGACSTSSETLSNGINQIWPKHDFRHVKRDWNASAGRLASEALQKEKGWIVMDDQDRQDLSTLNRLNESLLPRKTNQRVRVAAITRAAIRRRH